MPVVAFSACGSYDYVTLSAFDQNCFDVMLTHCHMQRQAEKWKTSYSCDVDLATQTCVWPRNTMTVHDDVLLDSPALTEPQKIWHQQSIKFTVKYRVFISSDHMVQQNFILLILWLSLEYFLNLWQVSYCERWRLDNTCTAFCTSDVKAVIFCQYTLVCSVRYAHWMVHVAAKMLSFPFVSYLHLHEGK